MIKLGTLQIVINMIKDKRKISEKKERKETWIKGKWDAEIQRAIFRVLGEVTQTESFGNR